MAEVAARIGAIGRRRARQLVAAVREFRLTERDRRARAWIAAGNDRTLRLDYDLTESSQVFDLGGYERQWASDIYATYRCQVHVFEPVERFAARIERRFARNPAIHVHRFGLAGETKTIQLTVDADRSSAFVPGTTVASETEAVALVRAADFFESHGIGVVDLMKVNIEGGEYDLLEHLLDAGLVGRIRDIQVQFHDFVPDAPARMRAIQTRLSSSHKLTYQTEFVWENWRRSSS